ncbi:hypothetical protein [Streptomyces mirabilis]|uniref:hypothetical protein n=1 Tax=Streptomyces mirabilis TaxID=68239 RepID=UPI0039A40549
MDVTRVGRYYERFAAASGARRVVMTAVTRGGDVKGATATAAANTAPGAFAGPVVAWA